MGATLDRQREIQTEAEKIFESQIPNNWIIRKRNPDIFIDYSIEIGENGEPTGNIFYVQLKGISTLNLNYKEVKHQLETKHLKYFRDDLDVPAFLIVIDINRKEGYWIFLQKYIKNNFQKEILQHTKTIRIPILNNLSNIKLFYNSILEAKKYLKALKSTSVFYAVKNIKDKYPEISLKVETEKNQINLSIKDYKIPFRIKVKNEKIESYKNQIEQFQKTGEYITLNKDDIDIEGSELFKDIITETDVTEIKFKTIDTVKSCVTILTRDNNNQLSTLLSPISGKTQFNSEHFHFYGALDDSPLNLELDLAIDKNSRIVDVQSSMSVDFIKWKGKSILLLPQEEKLFNFFCNLINNYTVELFLEIGGVPFLKAKEKIGKIYDMAEAFNKIHKFVYICKSLKYNIPFPVVHEVFKINNIDLETMFNLLKNGKYISSGDNYKISFSKETSDNNYPFKQGMIIENYESIRNIKLDVRDTKIILNNVTFQLLHFEIEDINNYDNNGIPFTRLNLKGTDKSKVIHSYKHELSDKLL
jgi:hypothetical protein